MFSRRCIATVARNARYARLGDKDVQKLRAIVSPNVSDVSTAVLTEPSDVTPYCVDWIGKYKAAGTSVVVKPRTTAEVQAILAYCNEKRIAVVPQGGNTGLVGGSVPVHDELVLSLSRMNTIESIDGDGGVATVQAGVVLQTLDEAAREHGLTVPLDLGAKGSCQIGGNVSTNAGGIRFLRYGSLHGSVLGLEAVLPDGRLLSTMTSVRKDNTGYDLKQLFIGSEGTLGVVTRVTLAMPPRPRSVRVALLAAATFDDIVRTLRLAKQTLGEILSAFEFLDAESVELVTSELSRVEPPPLPAAPANAVYALVETRGSCEEHDEAKMNTFIERALEEGVCVDGTLAQTESQEAALWALRETVAEAAVRRGATWKYDVSLPIEHYYALVERVRERFAAAGVDPATVTVTGYGHVGDLNLHLNVVTADFGDTWRALLEPWVYEQVAAAGGSVSAEHGIGFQKRNHLHYSKSETAIELMRQVKRVFDPNGIMNPYKLMYDDESRAA